MLELLFGLEVRRSTKVAVVGEVPPEWPQSLSPANAVCSWYCSKIILSKCDPELKLSLFQGLQGPSGLKAVRALPLSEGGRGLGRVLGMFRRHWAGSGAEPCADWLLIGLSPNLAWAK